MITTKDKIKIAENLQILVLYKEGIFYRLYNQHAMLFVENIRPFKVSTKFVKTVDQYVYSIGFPISSFDSPSDKNQLSIKQQLQNLDGKIKNHKNDIEWESIQWKNVSDYEQWCIKQKENIEQNPKKTVTDKTNGDTVPI